MHASRFCVSMGTLPFWFFFNLQKWMTVIRVQLDWASPLLKLERRLQLAAEPRREEAQHWDCFYRGTVDCLFCLPGTVIVLWSDTCWWSSFLNPPPRRRLLWCVCPPPCQRGLSGYSVLWKQNLIEKLGSGGFAVGLNLDYLLHRWYLYCLHWFVTIQMWEWNDLGSSAKSATATSHD